MLVIIDRTDMDKLSAYSSQRGYKAGASCLPLGLQSRLRPEGRGPKWMGHFRIGK